MAGNKHLAMEENAKMSNGLTKINGHKNGIVYKNGYSHIGSNGHTVYKNGHTNGLNGYSHYKNGHCTSENAYILGTDGYSKGMNGYVNGSRELNNNYIPLPGQFIYPISLERVLLKTKRLTSKRLKVLIVFVMVMTQALMTIALSYKPSFKTVAPLAITVCSDILSTGLALVCMLSYDCSMNCDKLRNMLYACMCQRPKDSLLAAIFMVISPVMDQLQQLALRDVGTKSFRMVSHVGILVTLILCFYSFRRKPRPLQVWSILTFVGCIQLMEYVKCPGSEEFSFPHKLAKWIWVSASWAAVFLRMGLTSLLLVFQEHFIRMDPKVSVWVRLVQIGFWKTSADVLRLVYIDGFYIQENGFFHGFDSLVWFYTLMRSLSILLGCVCILYFDSVGKSLQQMGGILLGMTAASVLLYEPFCIFSFLSCISALVATVAYMQWSGHGKDFTKDNSGLPSAKSAWEIWYLETLHGDVITLCVMGAVTYICAWALILFSVGEKIQHLLLKSMTPFMLLILLNVLLCFRLKSTSSTLVYRMSVLLCIVSGVTYLVVIIIKMDIKIKLCIM